MSLQEELKKRAAIRAVDFIESDMVIGLGTGSTANYAITHIGEKIQSGKLRNVVGIPSSERSEILAKELNIPLTDLEAQPTIDLTIDGADEVEQPSAQLRNQGVTAIIYALIFILSYAVFEWHIHVQNPVNAMTHSFPTRFPFF